MKPSTPRPPPPRLGSGGVTECPLQRNEPHQRDTDHATASTDLSVAPTPTLPTWGGSASGVGPRGHNAVMDPRLLTLPAAFGLAGASGLNASLPLLVISLLARAGLVQLAPPFDALQSDVAFYGILLVAVVEFAADKVPALDSVTHVLMGPLAATSGAIVFASQAGTIQRVDPGVTVVLSLLLGGGTAVGVHLTRATIRPALNVFLLGPVASAVEDAFSAVFSVVSLLAPLLLPVVAVVAGLGVWALWRRRSQRRAAEAAMRQWHAAYGAYYQQVTQQPPAYWPRR